MYFTPDGEGNLRRPTNASFISRLSETLENLGDEMMGNTTGYAQNL
jgi:hypothetical protein